MDPPSYLPSPPLVAPCQQEPELPVEHIRHRPDAGLGPVREGRDENAPARDGRDPLKGGSAEGRRENKEIGVHPVPGDIVPQGGAGAEMRQPQLLFFTGRDGTGPDALPYLHGFPGVAPLVSGAKTLVLRDVLHHHFPMKWSQAQA